MAGNKRQGKSCFSFMSVFKYLFKPKEAKGGEGDAFDDAPPKVRRSDESLWGFAGLDINKKAEDFIAHVKRRVCSEPSPKA